MSTFFIEKRSRGKRRIFRKAAVLTSEISLVTVKIELAFGIKKPHLIFQTGRYEDICERGLVLQQPQVFFLSFNLAAADEQDERRHVPVGCFQSFNVFRAEYRRNDGNQMAALEQRQIHEQPCYATVAVNKRMDGHKPLMKANGVFDRMIHLSPFRRLLNEVLHESRNFFGTRKLVGSPATKMRLSL